MAGLPFGLRLGGTRVRHLSLNHPQPRTVEERKVRSNNHALDSVNPKAKKRRAKPLVIERISTCATWWPEFCLVLLDTSTDIISVLTKLLTLSNGWFVSYLFGIQKSWETFHKTSLHVNFICYAFGYSYSKNLSTSSLCLPCLCHLRSKSEMLKSPPFSILCLFLTPPLVESFYPAVSSIKLTIHLLENPWNLHRAFTQLSRPSGFRGTESMPYLTGRFIFPMLTPKACSLGLFHTKLQRSWWWKAIQRECWIECPF